MGVEKEANVSGEAVLSARCGARSQGKIFRGSPPPSPSGEGLAIFKRHQLLTGCVRDVRRGHELREGHADAGQCQGQ